MREEFTAFMSTAYSPELSAEYTLSFKIFEDLQLDEIEDWLLNQLMDESNTDNLALRDIFSNKITNTLVDALKMHGVFVTDVVNARELNIILMAIFAIQYNDDAEGILNIVNDVANSKDKLLDLIELTMNTPVSESVFWIERVNDSLIDKLREMYENGVSVAVESEIPIDQFHLNKARNVNLFFTNVVKIQNTVISAIKQHTIKLGSDFEQFIKIFMTEEWNKLPIRDKALEIYAAAMMSNDGYKNPLEVFSKYSHDLFNDLTEITKVQVQINYFISEFQKFELAKEPKS